MTRQLVNVNVKTYWWADEKNFGDRMAALLLDRFAAIQADWRPVSKADLVVTGSVLEHIPPRWDGVILGAGKLHADSRLQLHNNTARILAIRGPLSAQGIKGDYVLGDPGLLADELVRVETKKYRLGVVPHISDGKLASDPRWQEFYPKIIDPRGDPLTVIRHIGECEKIVTSSLHGMIVADSFGIPRRFEYTPQFDQDGGLFKFTDYSKAINTPFRVGTTTRANKFHVEDRKDELWDAFRELAKIVRQK